MFESLAALMLTCIGSLGAELVTITIKQNYSMEILYGDDSHRFDIPYSNINHEWQFYALPTGPNKSHGLWIYPGYRGEFTGPINGSVITKLPLKCQNH